MELITQQSPSALATPLSDVGVAGQMANELSAAFVFTHYKSKQSANTLRTQKAALLLFGRYLAEKTVKANRRKVVKVAGVNVAASVLGDPDEMEVVASVIADCLQGEAAAWSDITHGLVQGFVLWMLDMGYSIATVNNRLSAVKVYAKLAGQAGALSADETMRIANVEGYGYNQGKNLDKERGVTRVGAKKEEHVKLELEEVTDLLCRHADTPQGRRDRLIMCLLLDHGLRVSEVALLEGRAFDLKKGLMTFYRPKVKKTQTHKLTKDTLDAAKRYILKDAPVLGRIFVGSAKGGKLSKRPMQERSINKRVAYLGRTILGIPNLSPHDCRHYWATTAANNGTDPYALRDGGGWSSLTMPSRYVEDATVANERVKLGK